MTKNTDKNFLYDKFKNFETNSIDINIKIVEEYVVEITNILNDKHAITVSSLLNEDASNNKMYSVENVREIYRILTYKNRPLSCLYYALYFEGYSLKKKEQYYFETNEFINSTNTLYQYFKNKTYSSLYEIVCDKTLKEHFEFKFRKNIKNKLNIHNTSLQELISIIEHSPKLRISISLEDLYPFLYSNLNVYKTNPTIKEMMDDAWNWI